jgi:hypothetical protein
MGLKDLQPHSLLELPCSVTWQKVMFQRMRLERILKLHSKFGITWVSDLFILPWPDAALWILQLLRGRGSREIVWHDPKGQGSSLCLLGGEKDQICCSLCSIANTSSAGWFVRWAVPFSKTHSARRRAFFFFFLLYPHWRDYSCYKLRHPAFVQQARGRLPDHLLGISALSLYSF